MSSKKHGGHHGGAWKVAYADFVTAMMALFLVLWLASQDQKIKEAVERSFRNPFGTLTKESTGIISNQEMQAVNTTSGSFDSASAVELTFLRKFADDLLKSLQTNPEVPDESTLHLEISPEGMRVTVFDRNQKPIFKPDSSEFTPVGDWIFSTLAWGISRHKEGFSVELEGHTEQRSDPENADFGNWQLSSNRANAALRKLIQHGVLESQIRKVAGFADTMPLEEVPPNDERNRRVTIFLKIKPGTPF